jgi:RNA polymerase sigma-70 factor, ECF subfamily
MESMRGTFVTSRDDVERAIEDVQRGDRERFALVVECYHLQLHAYVSALVHDAFDADDLAQQTFIFAYQHIQEYHPGTRFLAWLKSIAFNLVRDHRAQAQRSQSARRFLRDQISRRASETAGAPSIDSRLDALEHCVEGLSKEQREFLQRTCNRACTLDEIAGEMNRSGVAVRKQLSRLFDALRGCVERRVNGQTAELGVQG